MKSDSEKNQPVAEKKGISRRTVVKTAGAAGVAAATGVGLFGGTPPAFAQKRTIHYLMDSYFISGAKDVHLAINDEYQKQTGVEVKMEFINQNDLNTRLTAAVEAGAGPDMTILKWNMPHLFAGGMADHNALMADIDASDYYGFMNDATIVDGVYRAMPTYMTPNAWVYRTDIFEELGISPFPETMDDYLVAGKKLKGQRHADRLHPGPHPGRRAGKLLHVAVGLRWPGSRREPEGDDRQRGNARGDGILPRVLERRVRPGRPVL